MIISDISPGPTVLSDNYAEPEKHIVVNDKGTIQVYTKSPLTNGLDHWDVRNLSKLFIYA